jgi:hypothetical protein
MRIASFIAAGVIGLFSLGLLAAGGLLLWGDAQKDDNGYLSTARERFATNGYAMSTDNLDVDADGTAWIIDRGTWGKVRVDAVSRDGKPVFVGIARTGDVDRYLRDTRYDLVRDIEYSPFDADYRKLTGDKRPAPPARQDFWAASAHGAGTQALTWDVDDGDWSVVVMNADASAGVDVGVKAGAELPFLPAAGWGVLGGGLITLALSAVLAIVGIRGPRPQPRVAVAA